MRLSTLPSRILVRRSLDNIPPEVAFPPKSRFFSAGPSRPPDIARAIAMEASPPVHCVRINPSAAKRAKTDAEYESFAAGPPSVVSEEIWQAMQQGVKLGAPVASKKQKVDCVYINLDSRPDRNESIEAELSREGPLRAPPRLQTGAHASPLPAVVQASRRSGYRR